MEVRVDIIDFNNTTCNWSAVQSQRNVYLFLCDLPTMDIEFLILNVIKT